MVSYPCVCIIIPVVPPYGYFIFQYRRVCKYQRGNQNPYIEEEQTTQWQKKKSTKGKQRSTKHTYKTKDRVTRTWKPEMNLCNFPHKGLCYGWSICLNRLSWLIYWLIDLGYHDSYVWNR